MADKEKKEAKKGKPKTPKPATPRTPYSYGSRDVQPGYESQGWTPKKEPWGKDPWTEEQ